MKICNRACSESRLSPEKIILAVAASDAHVVANHLIAILLKDVGYDVWNLGAATTIDEIMEAYQKRPDSIAIIIGSLNGHAVEDLRGLSVAKQNYQVRCPVIVGGNLSVGANKTDEPAHRLLADGVDIIATSPDDLIPILARIVHSKRTDETYSHGPCGCPARTQSVAAGVLAASNV